MHELGPHCNACLVGSVEGKRTSDPPPLSVLAAGRSGGAVGGAHPRCCECRRGTRAHRVACVEGSCMGWAHTAMRAWWGVWKANARLTHHPCQCWQRGAAAALSAVLTLGAASADAARGPTA